METEKEIRKLQATLIRIANKENVFFNVSNFLKMDLIKEHGKTINNKTNWVLTEKSKMILNFQI